jgi:Ca2+-binding RTX toxin-like protein
MDGGAGIDFVSYYNSATVVSVIIATGLATGEGNDTITGFENINGSQIVAGGDTLIGNTANNVIWAYNGSDVIDGGAGNDTIYAGTTGTIGADTDATGNDTITGGAGNDQIFAGAGIDTVIYSGNRADYTITAVASGFTIVDNRNGSPDGTDTVFEAELFQFADGTVQANSLLIFGDGKDQAGVANTSIEGTYFANSSDNQDWSTATYGLIVDARTPDSIMGAADTITTGSGNDSITAGSGNDSIIAGAGNDTIDGGAGNDTIIGGLGADSISGGNGNDIIAANTGITGAETGINTIDGGDGNDSIYTSANADVLIGGNGIDRLYYTHSTAGVTINLATNTSSGGYATGDTISGFEEIIACSTI